MATYAITTSSPWGEDIDSTMAAGGYSFISISGFINSSKETAWRGRF